MTPRTKWACLLLLIVFIGGGIALAGWMIWKRSRQAAGIPLDQEKIKTLRRRLDENPRSIFIYHPRISYRLKPSFRGLRHDSPTLPHVTNSRGILGEDEVNPGPRVRKILFLGDSVAYGEHVPYEEVFVSRMAAAAGPDYQILNAGCPGWSTHQELDFFQTYLSDLPIDTVVIVFTINDLLRFEWVWRDEQSFQMSAELRGLGGMVHSRLTARELKDLRDNFSARTDLQPLAELNNTCLSSYLPGRWFAYRADIEPALRELAGERKVIIAAIPARPQLESLNRGGDPDTVLFPQRRLEEITAELQVGFLDLREAFRTEKGLYDTALFLAGQPGMLHLSPEGHRRLTEWLWPEIKRRTTP